MLVFGGVLQAHQMLTSVLKVHRLAELLTARWNLDQGCLQSGSSMIEFAGGKVVVIHTVFKHVLIETSGEIAPNRSLFLLRDFTKNQSAPFSITPFAPASLISKECATTSKCFESKDIEPIKSPAANCMDCLLHFSYEGSSKGDLDIWIQPQRWHQPMKDDDVIFPKPNRKFTFLLSKMKNIKNLDSIYLGVPSS